MKTEITKKEIMSRFKKVYSLRFETGYKISRFIDPDYYTCGVYGWNSDIYKRVLLSIAIYKRDNK